ncbi:MAG: ABC transporter ATP-binding protein [Candidatus Omnitrophica bacterium]|nr:ABC transporter ATP-binding protein [Candidatus Omnitrophota bacterium]
MLEAIGIHKVYKNGGKELRVLKGIDLKIEKGAFVSVLGPSGAGKSTLLHILGGLDKPTQGQAMVEGQDIYRLSDRKRAHLRNSKIGFVFQAYHLLPEFSTLENVMLPALIKKQTQGQCEASRRDKDTRAQAKEILRSVGLGNRAGHRPNELSGGEQQRTAIARALINEPEILLCDEPTGNLDSASGKEIIELLYKLNKEKGATVMVVTHDEQIAGKTDRVVHIRDGALQ